VETFHEKITIAHVLQMVIIFTVAMAARFFATFCFFATLFDDASSPEVRL